MVLLDAAAHPVEAHVKSFGLLPEHVSGEYAVGGCAVGIDWSGLLRVAHFDEDSADGNSLLNIEEDRSSFGLGGRSHDGADGLTFGEDLSIQSGSRPDVRWWCIVDQVVLARSTTACFGLNKIRCVTVNVEAQVASVEPDYGVRLRGCVFH